MESAICELEKDGFLYEVFSDIFEVDGSFDFGSEKENADYLARFASGEFCSYDVTQKKICQCCGKAGELVDCLSGIHARAPQEALRLFVEEFAPYAAKGVARA